MDEFLNKNKVGLPEIQQWVEDKMPDIVKDLTRICRIRKMCIRDRYYPGPACQQPDGP